MPLDIDVPCVNVESLRKWEQEYSYEAYKLTTQTLLKLNLYERIQSYEDFREYEKEAFWSSSYFKHRYTEHNETPWIGEFDKKFPDLVDFFDKFCIRRLNTIGMLTQNKFENSASCSPLHVDEAQGFGIRVYLNADNGMYFHSVREEKLGSSDLIFGIPEEVNGKTQAKLYDSGKTVPNTDMVYDKEQRISTPKSNFPFFLNNYSAGHAVDQKTNNDKIVMVLMSGKKNEHAFHWDDLDKLVSRSIKKYPEYCVWHVSYKGQLDNL